MFIYIFSLYLRVIHVYSIINTIDTNNKNIKQYTSFASLNYTWNDEHNYEEYIASKQFIIENNLLAGINMDKNKNIYVSVPRWKSGVPATLNKLVLGLDNNATDTNEKYLLEPFPSWEMQREGVQGDLQNVQSMTIDNNNIMWVIDVGRRNFFETGINSNPIDAPARGKIIGVMKSDIFTQIYLCIQRSNN